MSDVIKSSWANIVANNDFICVETWSGYRHAIRDYKGVQFLLSVDIDDETLGHALLDALQNSRFVLPKDDLTLYDYKQCAERNLKWIEDLMGSYKYKVKRDLFKNMKNCNVICQNEIITIKPTFHEKLEAWSGNGISEGDYVFVSTSDSPQKIGSSVRVAMSRCKTKV